MQSSQLVFSNMQDTSANNKRIAKNTLFLYIRMLLTTAVGLYTSRVVLQVLGISDYGVYTVMGGLIGFLSYLNTLLAGGTSRFLTIGLGENNPKKLKLTFSTTFVLTMLTAFAIFITGETIGLWFVNNYLNIDQSRMTAANWVYQCALISAVLTVAQSPFTASIISHERMNIYAYMSIFDAIMKLLIVYVLLVINIDKLILYSILLLIVNTLSIIIYRIYCIKKFEECSFSIKFDKKIFKEMFAFSSWNLMGSLSAIMMNQGVSILLNIFYGTIVNAAMGVANQVNHIIQQLYSNFQLAARPQIMKYYAQKEFDSMFELMINTSKYCAYLLIILIVPIIVYIEPLLNIWLETTPNYTVEFIRLTLIYTLFKAIDTPLTAGIHAVGKMKLPNMTTAVINMLVFPITLLVCYLGGSPVTANIIFVINAPIVLAIDLMMLRHFIGFPIKAYVSKSLLPVFVIFFISLILPLLLSNLSLENNLIQLFCFGISTAYVVAVIFFIALPKSMRDVVLLKLKETLNK